MCKSVVCMMGDRKKETEMERLTFMFSLLLENLQGMEEFIFILCTFQF